MPMPRYVQIGTGETPYVHVVSRTVRRSFLCGKDKYSGKNFNHRRQCLEDEMHRLAGVFALDICAYAIMSNHYHIVLHINLAAAREWSHDEIIERWHQLFKGSLQSQQYMAGETLPKANRDLLKKQVKEWRSRLTNISWFMRILNEKIARKANKEDDCTGRFWEGRFKSQALLDEKALIACMAYVDLNPIRANMAKTPEASAYTSIKRRCEAAKSEGRVPGVISKQPCQLEPFVGYPRANMPAGLPFRLTDYLELVDWTGRQIREDKRGAIDSDLPTILERLDIDEDHWLYMGQNFESSFKTLVGSVYSLKSACR
ncbi:MAG: transposase, partial [Pseudomonadota bacterium]